MVVYCGGGAVFAGRGVPSERTGMRGSFDTLITARRARRDTKLLGDFSQLYCRHHHASAARGPLVSEGAALGVYGRRPPVVCEACAELLRYAERRRAFCPYDPKPFCSACETHCYSAEMAETMRRVMRYSGPRSMLRGHALQGLRHMAEVRRIRAVARRKAASAGNEKPHDHEGGRP